MSKKIKVKKVPIKLLRKNAIMPKYADLYAAGCDFYAAIDEPVIVEPGKPVEIPFGIALETPPGYKLTIWSRSGLFRKHFITVYYGLIDSNYRGELSVFLINNGNEPYTVNPGDRVAQGVFERYIRADFVKKKKLSKTKRGKNGFGSTGQ